MDKVNLVHPTKAYFLPKNLVKNLTVDQLKQIYEGTITNWKEVGGENLEIVVVSRDSSSGTFEAWRDLVLKGAKVSPRAQLQASNGAVVQAVSKNKYAIGYIYPMPSLRCPLFRIFFRSTAVRIYDFT